MRFAGALTLTNNAIIVTQSGANITTAAGDTCIIRATSASVVEVLAYTPFVDQSVGYGQTWQGVTGSRAKSVTYTNSTGKPILVHVQKTSAQNTLTLTVGALEVSRFGGYGIEAQAAVTAIVPNGSTYIVGGTGSINYWVELR